MRARREYSSIPVSCIHYQVCNQVANGIVMDSSEKERLKQQTPLIVSRLRVEYVADELYREGLLAQAEFEELTETQASTATERKRKARRLLMMLLNSSRKDSYSVFCGALEKTGYHELLSSLGHTVNRPRVTSLVNLRSHAMVLLTIFVVGLTVTVLSKIFDATDAKPPEVRVPPTITPQPSAVINLDKTHGKDAIKEVNCQLNSHCYIRAPSRMQPISLHTGA